MELIWALKCLGTCCISGEIGCQFVTSLRLCHSVARAHDSGGYLGWLLLLASAAVFVQSAFDLYCARVNDDTWLQIPRENSWREHGEPALSLSAAWGRIARHYGQLDGGGSAIVPWIVRVPQWWRTCSRSSSQIHHVFRPWTSGTHSNVTHQFHGGSASDIQHKHSSRGLFYYAAISRSLVARLEQ